MRPVLVAHLQDNVEDFGNRRRRRKQTHHHDEWNRDSENQDHEEEIIYINVILVDPGAKKVVDSTLDHQFHSYVRPAHHKRVSKELTEKTGIRQRYVDSAEKWSVVLHSLEKWLQSHNVEKCVLVVLDTGEFDRMMRNQCTMSMVDMPLWAKDRVVDIRVAFQEFFGKTVGFVEDLSLVYMMKHCKLRGEGNATHSRDQAFNIAMLVVYLMQQGNRFDDTTYERLPSAPAAHHKSTSSRRSPSPTRHSSSHHTSSPTRHGSSHRRSSASRHSTAKRRSPTPERTHSSSASRHRATSSHRTSSSTRKRTPSPTTRHHSSSAKHRSPSPRKKSRTPSPRRSPLPEGWG